MSPRKKAAGKVPVALPVQQPSEPAAWKCWHCGTLDPAKPGRCNCMFCCIDGGGYSAHGPCGFCEGRLAQIPLLEKLDHYGIDPADIKHWRLVRNTTGGSHRVFDPVYPGEYRD